MNSAVDCRDRTAEFFSAVAQLQRAQQQHSALPGAGLPGKSASSFGSSGSNFHGSEFDERPEEALLGAHRSNGAGIPPPPPKQQSQFTQAAQHIGRSIHLVTSKLEKLGKLARQRSLFNDPATEINELTFVIKTDLATLHQELEVLHAWVAEQRGGGGSGGASVHAARNSSAIVDSLKLQLISTTKNFQEVLQVRTQALKEQHQRRKQFEQAGGSDSSAASAASAAPAAARPATAALSDDGGASIGNAQVRKRVGGAGGSNPFDALMSQAASAAAKQSSSSANGGGTLGAPDWESTSADDDAPLSFVTPGAGGVQAQDMVVASRDQTDEYLSSRTRAVEDIESTIVQLGEMYQRLVHIVGMQEETVITIDSNMDQALEHMERGQQELVNYYDSIKGSKWLIIKVFAVLLAFLVFFMVFVA